MENQTNEDKSLKIKILDVILNWFRNKMISKTVLFEDDTEITFDSIDYSIVDSEGEITTEKIEAIENRLNIKINL